MRGCTNWIGGGATRPITQGRRQYSILARLRVNKLDGLKINKAEKVLSTSGDKMLRWLGPALNDFWASLTVDNSFPIIHLLVGAWLSLVERSVRDREVGGSNPLAPTRIIKEVDHSPEWSSCL